MSETSGVCAIVPRGQNDFRPRVFGMGILVGDREVVTCAHVVLYALGLGLRESPGAAGVRVCFPFANRFPCIDGTVERWFPTGRSTDGDVSDVAVIRLQKDAPCSDG